MVANTFVEENLTDRLDTTVVDSDDETDNNKHERCDDKNGGPSNIQKKSKKRKKGIVYVSNLPKHMNVTRIREYLGSYGDIGRVYLQPEKLLGAEKAKEKVKKKKRRSRHFTEGWIEFERKRVAKKVAERLNNMQIGTGKRSQFYDCYWVIKYLPRFKWVHLSERLSYEAAVHRQRLMTEVSQARKEANFFQSNLDKSELVKRKSKKIKNESTR